jgi:hypothetical protein
VKIVDFANFHWGVKKIEIAIDNKTKKIDHQDEKRLLLLENFQESTF